MQTFRDITIFAGALSSGLLFLPQGGLRAAGHAKTTKEKPNIVFILADDLGYGDVGFQGQQRFKTPNIDRLAARGLVFTDHYAGCTVSAPSRCCLLTGYHTGHAWIRGNREHSPEGQEPLKDSILTVAELLRSAGYVTGAFGKWGLGSPGSEGDPVNQGFDEFFGFNCQRLAHNYYPFHLWHNREKVILEGNAGQGRADYAPDLIHREALKFLETNKDKPFFLYYPTTIPHAELVAPERLMQQFRDKLLPEKSFRGTDDGPTYKLGPYGSQTEAHAAFAGMVTRLDELVGEILKKLEDLGISDKTLVVFTSDNGPHLEGGADPDFFDSNGPLRGYKRDLTEGGIREPFIVSWPGRITPGTTDHVAAFWDFLPTCCDLAGISVPEGLDGISYFPLLAGKPGKQKDHRYLYWEFHEKGTSKAIRLQNWKGIQKNPKTPLELYDLSADPGEKVNVAGDHPSIIRKMQTLLLSARTPSSLWPSE